MLLRVLTSFTSCALVSATSDGTVDIQSNAEDPDDRSVWNIIWSCLVIVVACIWISVHPNVPAVNDSDFKIMRRRLSLMIWALLVPDMVLLWAV